MWSTTKILIAWTIPVRRLVMMKVILKTRFGRAAMANGLGVQLAIFLVPLAIIVCVLFMRKRKTEHAEPMQVVQPAQPAQPAPARIAQQPKAIQPAAPPPVAASVPVEVAPTTAVAT